MQDLPFTTTYDEDASTLTVTGEVDEASGALLRHAIEKGSDDFRRDLVVDLSEVLYFPSLAVGVLATAGKRAADSGHQLDVLATEGSIAQRVLTVCGLPHRTA